MPERPAMSWSKALTWGAYLACSWTWCIGMFLPLLMVRDFGAAGWWVFAVPNVVGAAAMGWVLRSSAAASRLRAGHLGMGRAFSVVTIAFHAYFLGWMGGGLLPLGIVAGVALCSVLVVGMVIRLREGFRWVSLVVWLLSASVLVRLLVWMPGSVGDTLATSGELPSTDVLWMAPVCALGFALCPYLDLTFLRARRLCDGATGAAAFTVGFGVMFASMIVLTLAYAGVFAEPVLGMEYLDKPKWARLVIAHIGLQAAFTIGVHVVELATVEPARRPVGGDLAAAMAGDADQGVGESGRSMRLGRVALLVSLLVAGLAGAASKVMPALPAIGPLEGGMSAGEVGYRVFMGAYGLVFPGYVWVCVVPRRRSVERGSLLRAWGLGVAAAMPFFAVGFLWRETVWLAPGVVLVLWSKWWARPSRGREHADGMPATLGANERVG